MLSVFIFECGAEECGASFQAVLVLGKKMDLELKKIPILLKQCTYTIPENDHSSGAVNRIGTFYHFRFMTVCK